MKESEIQKAILHYLRAAGHFVWRSYTGPVMHRNRVFAKNPIAGYPDISGIHKSKPGHLFCIEVKSQKGILEPAQVRWKEDLERAGATYILARSVEDVIRELA